jgi:hypothetical protein
MTSLDDAQAAYDAIPQATKDSADVGNPQHKGRRIVPVLETTTLREIHDHVPEGETVVLATVMGDQVEFGLFQGVRNGGLGDASLDMTMRELIDAAVQHGEPGPKPGDPLFNPNA